MTSSNLANFQRHERRAASATAELVDPGVVAFIAHANLSLRYRIYNVNYNVTIIGQFLRKIQQLF